MGIFEKLGLDPLSILFYAVNLVILVLALWLLLFKPMKRIVKKNRDKTDELYNENERLKQETSEAQARYDELEEKTKVEAARIAAEVAEHAEKKSREIVDEAKAQAELIVRAARDDAQTEREQLNASYKSALSEVSVEIAKKLLSRELSSKDNAKIIDEVLSDWEDK